jgi:hypothetical protein
MMGFRTALAAATFLLLSASACASQSSEQALPSSDKPSKEITAKDFDPENFDRSTVINNEWFPLRPGTQLVFEGSTREEGKSVPHRVVFTVTDLAKVVSGVRTVMIWERDYSEGELVETELAFFAQDNAGNVWHLGQYPEEYEQGKFVRAPAWLARMKGARAGIVMKAHPRLGAPSYSQGFAPAPINWVDHAKAYKMGVTTCVPLRCFKSVLVTREFETGKPDSYQEKYYARGVGNVRVGWAGSKDKDREVLVLIKRVLGGPAQLGGFRAGALSLERHAYKVSKDVYGRTAPAQRR